MMNRERERERRKKEEGKKRKEKAVLFEAQERSRIEREERRKERKKERDLKGFLKSWVILLPVRTIVLFSYDGASDFDGFLFSTIHMLID